MSDLDQAWAEIRDCMADDLLNAAQKKAFVISILKGQLANPPGEADTKPLVALGNEIISAACLWHGTHGNGDEAPEKALEDAIQAFLFGHTPGEADKSPIPIHSAPDMHTETPNPIHDTQTQGSQKCD